jgi:RNA polymerase sigma-70 factor, ECF subfamily
MIQSLATEPVSDEVLMKRIARHNAEALGELYDRYSAILKALIVRVVHNEAEADDLLQEVFMQIWRQAKNYSPKRGKTLGWVVTLTRRRAIDRLRKRQAYTRAKERFEEKTELHPEAWVHSRIENDIIFDDIREFLCERIESLPPFQKQAIELAYFRGLSQREIAAFTHTPLGTIKTRLELGLRKLTDALQGLHDKI